MKNTLLIVWTIALSSSVHANDICSANRLHRDYNGYDIENTNRATSEECCDDCLMNPQCNVVVWTSYDNGTCWLKSKKGKSRHIEGAIAMLAIREEEPEDPSDTPIPSNLPSSVPDTTLTPFPSKCRCTAGTSCIDGMCSSCNKLKDEISTCSKDSEIGCLLISGLWCAPNPTPRESCKCTEGPYCFNGYCDHSCNQRKVDPNGRMSSYCGDIERGICRHNGGAWCYNYQWD